ncbi:hypothetical protein ARTSIC4J27_678 [Pseudarthrobacter siccitolerans]|uniref:Uncharacterized protein n=1 Tax=Pseudarthrobacter siccitolerans TaxID=861266 RepID=A0A024GZ19_9MICC|nr:hypothetical protein ARTSIC4J27_678 [Pseudarthrobacter siccitolerans]
MTPNGGTRTSTEFPGARAVTSSSVYRTAVANTARGTGGTSDDGPAAFRHACTAAAPS